MSRMGMLKTAISGRFGLGGQVVGGDVPTNIDVGATQPDTPNHHHTRSKKDKRSKSDDHHSKATNTKQVGPAIMLKKENQDLKHGHDPNKINSTIGKRQIIVEPSTRHMKYQPSNRNISAEPSTGDIRMKSPQKSARTTGLDKKSSSKNMNSSSGSPNTNGVDKKSSIRNLGSPTKMGTSPRVANVNNVEAFDNKKKLKLGMAGIEETIGSSNLVSIDENNSRKTNQNGTSKTTSSNTSKGSGSPTTPTSKRNGSANNKKTLTRTPIMNSIDKGNSIPSTIPLVLGTIDENNNSSSRSSSSRNRNRGTIDENNNGSRNSSRNRSTIDENNNNSSRNSSRSRSTIDENNNNSSRNSSRNRSTIDENKPNSSSSSNSNLNNDTTARSASSQKSSNSSSGKSPVSTSTKSTSSTNTTKSTSTKSAEPPASLNHNINNKSVTSLNITKSNLSSHSSTSANNNSNATNLGNSPGNMSNKSAHSLTARSEKTSNSDNRSKSRPKSPRKRGPSLATPAHFNRDRPSTVLITRKEMEDILAEKQMEEAMEEKTLPPKSGTMSTDLWVDAANKAPQSEDFSVASGTTVEEESPFGKKPHLGLPEDEYDIDFFDITEEEITEHTINSGNQSFVADELHFADSIEQRCTTIRFDEYDELQTCLHINDYTKHEISRSWYKRDDYDKMVDLARKTASKAVKREKELRDELENMLRVSVSPKAGRKNGEMRPEDPAGGDDNRSTHSKGADGKRKKPIEYRGLEAWTPEGSQKCRSLKENAIEQVWNEQSRQWEEGAFDPEAIAEVYRPVAEIALKAAHERALADANMVKRLTEQEKKKKKNRTGFKRATSAIKKTSKSTGKAVGHAAGKMLTGTGKGAVKIGKRSGKALVATATLDPKMMKEAVKVRIHGKKKRECKHELEVTTSKAAVERDIEELEESGSLSIQDSNSLPFYNPNPLDRRQQPSLPTTYEVDMASDKFSDDLSSANGGISAELRDSSRRTGDSESNSSSPKKKSKLKLLGIVPIPGTQKKYSEDRRQEREEKRKEKMSRRPSWESSMTTGKY